MAAAAALLLLPTVDGAASRRARREAWLEQVKQSETTSEKLVDALDAVARGEAREALRALGLTARLQVASEVAAARLRTDSSRGVRTEALTAAVAMLFLAVEENLTGPSEVSLVEESQDGDEAGSDGTDADVAAVAALAASGEEVVGRAFGADALAASIVILEALEITHCTFGASAQSAADTVASNADELLACWWYARANVLRQRLLGGPSAHIYAMLRPLFRRSVAALEKAHRVASDKDRDSGFWRDALAACHIEAALFLDSFGYVDDAGTHLRSASSTLGLEVALHGAMGTRTIYQADEKAQLVLNVARTTEAREEVGEEEDDDDDGDEAGSVSENCGNDDGAKGVAAAASEKTEEEGALGDASNTSSVKSTCRRDLSETLKGFDMSADGVMEAPRLSGDVAPTVDALRGIEQVMVLAMAVHVRREQSGDELQRWEMAPYVEAVLSQRRLVPMARRLAVLLQARHEKTRPRTRERSVVHMQEAADAHLAARPSFARRVCLSLSVWFPVRLQMQKELGECLIAMGLVGEGMRLFETMELWDSLISCYILLGKRPAGEALVKQRLRSSPDDPRLMNSLGDLTGDPSHYERAWEASGGRNVRSMRSLARYAARKKEWALSRQRWEKALRINPIHTQGWFELGYACMQLKDERRALQAFTRCTQLDGSNAHAWNNIAALSITVGRMDLAYSALNETVRHSNEDWHMWLNLAHASVKTRNFGSALRALNRVIDLTNGSKLDVEILEWMTDDLGALRAIADAHSDGDGEGGKRARGDHTAETETGDGEALASLGAAGDLDIDELVRCLCEDEDDAEEGTRESPLATTAASRSLELVWQEKGKRGLDLTFSGMKALLRRCMDSSVASGSEAARLWHVTSQFYGMTGEPEMARECLLKQVRALAGSGWRDDERLFHEYARASLALAASAKEQHTRRSLAAARMHLRGFLKQATDGYGDTHIFRDLSSALADVTELESSL